MKYLKPLCVLLAIFLYSSFGGAFASQKETTSTNKKVTEVTVEDGEIHIKTPKGDQVNLSQDEFKHLQALDKLASETTQQEQEREFVESDSSRYKVFTDQIVKTGSDIVVNEDQIIREDVVAIGGNITVKGRVNGNVVAIGGWVRVTPGGMIQGDAVSIGGDIESEPGAVIRGGMINVLHLGMGHNSWPVLGLRGISLMARIVKIAVFLLLAIVTFSIAPKNVEKIKNRINQEFWISLLIGFAVEMMIIPVFVILFFLLFITIIGIPAALIALPSAVVVYFLLAYTSGCYFAGEKIKENTALKPETPLMTLIVGILSVEAILLLAKMVGISVWSLTALSTILTIFGFMVLWLVVTVGLGAGLLTRFGTRPKDVKIDQKPKTAGENPPN